MQVLQVSSEFLIPPPPNKPNSKVHGEDKAIVSRNVPNYFYKINTGNTNLRRHLYKMHPEEYDRAITEEKWNYKLSTQTDDTAAHRNMRKFRNQDVPSFSPATFMDHLVRFVATDDQVGFDSLASFHAYCITY